jgi:raffinose/stachyose/melibiose transport system permease protein/N-acetylglucosamine transport system permease protein
VGGHAGLIIVYVSLSIPFTIFLIQGFFRTLPSVLEEAAYIDGCSPMRTFFSIMLPIGSPGIVTAAIFNFISLWNEFLLALTLLNDSQTYTLSIGLYALQGSMQYTGDWVALFAAVVVVTIPTLLVYLLLSRQIIEGLTMGAVKE